MDVITSDRGSYALALETSSDAGGVAVGQGGSLLESAPLDSSRRHAAELLPSIAALCQRHDIQPVDIGRIYVSKGPGSFTGLRIGITVARMMAFAGGSAVVGVATMDVIAQNALGMTPKAERLVVLLDARRGNVYGAVYRLEGNAYVAQAHPIEAAPDTFLRDQPPETAVLGHGVTAHRGAVENSALRIFPESLFAPRVQTVYRLGHGLAEAGQFDDPKHLVPTYIRKPSAEEVWERKHGDQ
jgi:tRNA threonylcarbamoyladenosine biosynthesis protein TsaB